MSKGKSRNPKKHWELFTSFKQRGEWVELQFMAEAAKHRFAVIKPWGDNLAYDVGIEHAANFLRVQVKSTTQRLGGGYRCQFRPKHRAMQKYAPNQIDLFAAYVIPLDVWYLIPATLIVSAGGIPDAMLCPAEPPVKKKSYRYECYREAWNLLTKSRAELMQFNVPPFPPSHHRKAGSRRVTKAPLLRLD